MADIALLSAGSKISYCVGGAEAGVHPKTKYTVIPQVTVVPEQNTTPNLIDVTRLSAEKYTEKIPGLVDSGEVLSVDANLTNELITAWDACVAAAKNKEMYFCIQIKGITKAYYFRGQPQPLGHGSLEPNAAVKTKLNIAVETIIGWDEAPTA